MFMLMSYFTLVTKITIIFEQNSDHITKRMVPVGNGYGHENASIVSTTTTSTVSSVTTTEQIAQTTNNVERGLVFAYHTTKRSRRKNYQSTPRCKFLVFVFVNYAVV